MRFILTIAFVSGFLFSTAQDTASFSKWSVTCQPLGIIDPFLTNITAGVQYRINKNIRAELKGGVIKSWFCIPNTESDFPDAVNSDEQNIRKAGFTINGEVKYFIISEIYIAVQLFYHDYVKTDNENVWRFAQSYTQRFEIEKSITDIGGNIMMGFLLERKSKRVYYEFFSGIGMKNKNLKIQNELPPDAELINDGGFEENGNFANDTPGSQIQPSFVLGITIGCKL